jgi:hypothetical protein
MGNDIVCNNGGAKGVGGRWGRPTALARCKRIFKPASDGHFVNLSLLN